jgi:hypothetical protein
MASTWTSIVARASDKSNQGARTIEDRCEQPSGEHCEQHAKRGASNAAGEIQGEHRCDQDHADEGCQAEGDGPPQRVPNLASHPLSVPNRH